MKLKTVIISLCMLLSITSCSLFDNGIKEYGNANYVDQSALGQDITWLLLDGTKYCLASILEGKPELEDGVAGFKASDNYSCEIFPIKDYKGLIAVHSVSKINMVNTWEIYASLEAINIPCKFLYDIPHKDSLLNGGQVKKLNDTNYCIYGTVNETYKNIGEVAFISDNIEYYVIPGHDLWIASKNKYDSKRYDIWYDTDKLKELPVELLFAINTY